MGSAALRLSGIFFTEELIDTIASNPKICKYIDMPLQHSEDSTLSG